MKVLIHDCQVNIMYPKQRMVDIIVVIVRLCLFAIVYFRDNTSSMHMYLSVYHLHSIVQSCLSVELEIYKFTIIYLYGPYRSRVMYLKTRESWLRQSTSRRQRNSVRRQLRINCKQGEQRTRLQKRERLHEEKRGSHQ